MSMDRKTCWPLIAVAVMLGVLGMTAPANAAIRVSITEGSNTKVFYSPSSQVGMVFTSIGSYDLVLQTAISNYPGAGSGGTVSQTLNVSSFSTPGSGTLPTLTVNTSLIDSVVGVGAGEVTGADLAAVTAAGLLLFTQPNGAALLVTSAISSPLATGPGAVANITTVNSAIVPTPATPLGSSSSGVGVADNTPLGYTLTSTLVLSGISVGTTGLAISATSTAALTPEPGSLAVWGLGAVGFVALSYRRRRAPKSDQK